MQSLPSVRRLVPPSLAPRPPANLLGGVDLLLEDEVTVKVGSAARTLTVAPDRRAPIVEGFDDEPTAIFRPRTLPKAPSTLVVFDDDEPTTLWKSAPASAAPVSAAPASGAPVSAVESVKPAAERTMRAADVRSALADALRALA